MGILAFIYPEFEGGASLHPVYLGLNNYLLSQDRNDIFYDV